jgi:putative redox protein
LTLSWRSSSTEDHGVASRQTYIRHIVGDEFEIAVGHHALRVDQPVADGGQDLGPAPTELFPSSLAACVAFYVRRFLCRHGLSTDGLIVDAAYSIATNPTRVGSITLTVHVPNTVPDGSRQALLAVARHCTVHNSREQAPEIQVELASSALPDYASINGDQ